MYVVIRKENKNDIPIYIRKTFQDAKAEMFREVSERGKKGPNSTDAGIFYEEKDGIINEYKNVVTVTPGFLYGESKDIKTEHLGEYRIMEVAQSVKNEFDNYYNKLDKSNKKGVLTTADIKKLKVGNIVDAKDMHGQWFVAKIIREYQSDTGTVRVHYNAWNPSYNETLKIKEGQDILATAGFFSNCSYTDKIIDEYCANNNEDIDILIKAGIIIPKNKAAALKVGDIIETADRTGKWYAAKVITINGDKVTVKFNGWPYCYNEQISTNSNKFAVLGSFTDVKRETFD
jgi:hypothetical protein